MRKVEERDNDHFSHLDHTDGNRNVNNGHVETSSRPDKIDDDSRIVTTATGVASNGTVNDHDNSNQIHPDYANDLSNEDNCHFSVGSIRVEGFVDSPLSFHCDLLLNQEDIDVRYSTGKNYTDLPHILTPPRYSEQSAKEQLIERERQARMERERARLKRQFTLRREQEEEEEGIVMNNNDTQPMGNLKNEHDKSLSDDDDDDDEEEEEDSKSIACTAGEEESDEENVEGGNVESQVCNTECFKDDKSITKLGFTMERFLKDNVGVEAVEIHPDLQAVSVPLPLSDVATSVNEEEEGESIASMEVRICNSDLSASCRTDHEEMTNDRNADPNAEEGIVSHRIPRLAQLTEARTLVDIADIDYASVGNMPPRSVRDEHQLPDLSGMSNASFDLTHTTVQESDTSICVPSVRTRASSIENNQYQVNTNIMMSPGSNNFEQFPVENVISSASYNSAESNPSETLRGENNALDNYGNLDANLIEGCDEHALALPLASQVTTMPFGVYSYNQDNAVKKDRSHHHESQDPVGCTLQPERSNAPLVQENCGQTHLDGITDHAYEFTNRVVRPGMIKLGYDMKLSKAHRRAQTTPIISSFIDDFDYCKYNTHDQTSNHSQKFEGSLRWNSISDPSYGAIDPEEDAPLLYPKLQNEEEGDSNGVFDLDSMIDSVFSSLRSMSTVDFQAEINDCDKYSSSHIIKRAISARFMPLAATLALELPISFAILSGSNGLCSLVGSHRYRILVALLPVTMALSGNCGLQSSILSSRAISHLQVARSNYVKWLIEEIQVTATLGVATGAIIGALAYHMSDFDAFFGFVLFLATTFALLTSGFIGTIAPLLFTFFFHREEEKWNSLLSTAFQDIIGCLSMVFCVSGCYWLFRGDNIDSSCV
mmetsp:Transcript_9057/g.17081  ORF Transcript_9057/g.17081 Transcript_9057/m.17081 type:complete len:884 (-) Transcript_9057:113-2764(-)